MVELTIIDPDIHTVKKTDGQGRVYLGKDWQEQEVRITVERVGEDD
jgi:hypothetical protein